MVTNPATRALLNTARLLPEDGATAEGKLSPFWGSLKRTSPFFTSDRILQIYAGTLVAGGAILAVGAFAGHAIDPRSLWLIVFLGIFAAVAERQSVQVHAYTDGSVSVLAILLAAVLFGPSAAIIVAFISFLSYFERPFARWVVWTASRVVVAGVAGLIAVGITGGNVAFLSLLSATAGAAVVEGVGSATLTAVTVGIRHRGSFWATLKAAYRVIAVTVPLYTPMVAVLAYAFLQLSPWTVLFFAVPALAAHRLLSLYQRQASLSEDLAAANARLEGASVSFAGALVAALDARDQYTGGHSAAVAIYARDIARGMAFSEADQQRVHLAGLLHDIGKVGLPPGILEKDGPLTAVERAQMESHVVIGERILSNVDGFDDLARIVRHHHERLDGAGYPDCLQGEEIPAFSRIIAVADAYNAMTSRRPYREALSTAEARHRMRQAAGTQFDPEVVQAFERLLEDSAMPYLVGERADFAVEANWRPMIEAAIEAAA